MVGRKRVSTAATWVFRPKRVLFERGALDHEMGRRLWDKFTNAATSNGAGALPEVRLIPSHNRVTGLPGDTPAEAYLEAKRTLVVGVRRGLDFAPCRPSADYQLPLVTSCPGLCEYCYLQTTLGRRPYVRVYVNVEEILGRARELASAPGRARKPADAPGRARDPAEPHGASHPRDPASARRPRPVTFEGAAVGDPVPVEPLTGSLAAAIEFFGRLEEARFRFVTKFPTVDGLLGLDHNGHTRIRVTVNTARVIRDFDHATPDLGTRLDTLERLAGAGYPVGAMVAPVILAGDWRGEYRDLFRRVGEVLGRARGGAGSRVNPGPADLEAPARPDGGSRDSAAPTLEVVTHRFTSTARRVILGRYPESGLPLDETGRRLKRGQFGYFKYVYDDDLLAEAKEFFARLAAEEVPAARLDYLV